MVDPGDLKTGAEAIQDSVISAPFPPSLEEAILAKLATPTFDGRYVAVRSSGTDEDSASHSFAGEASMTSLHLLQCGDHMRFTH